MKNDLKIVDVNIDDLKFAEYNPRKASKEQIDQVKKSIQRFGIVDPVIVNSAENRKNIIIGGHLRVKVLKDMGIKVAPVVYVNIPDIEKEKELNLRLNKNTGDWDWDMLANFDESFLLDVGFSRDELNNFVNVDLENINVNDINEVENIKTTDVKSGDMFQLGNHRLICGDCTDADVMEKLVQKEKVNHIITDPPYNIGVDYSKRYTSKKQIISKSNLKCSDSKVEKDYHNLIKTNFELALKYFANNGYTMYWCDRNYIYLFQQLFIEKGFDLSTIGLWIKECIFPISVGLSRIYEPLVIASKGTPYFNNKYFPSEILNQKLESAKDILEFLETNGIYLVKRVNQNEVQHTTQKPVELYEKIINKFTRQKDIILDSFAGSGSLLLACEILERRFFGIELQPEYCQVIIDRWEKLTGKKAEKIS